MIDFLIRFFTYNKIYLFSGIVLLLLVFIPSKEKISSKSKKFLYVCIVLWIICFTYRINTGNDITFLFNSSDDFAAESQPATIRTGPFTTYYSNDAGRKSKD